MNTLNVLLVEDDPLIQLVHKKTLTNINCSVETANNGEQALDKSSEHEYDVILMDVGLPLLNGIEATAEIRRRETASKKHIPIIGVTGFDDEKTQKACLAAGMDEVITKPVEEGELEKILLRFC